MTTSAKIGSQEKRMYCNVRDGVMKRIDDSQKEIKVLIDFLHVWSVEDIEKAAYRFSRYITIIPFRNVAAAIIGRKFEEGAAGGSSSSLGIEGIRSGTAWYPGIISVLSGFHVSRLISLPMSQFAKLLWARKINAGRKE